MIEETIDATNVGLYQGGYIGTPEKAVAYGRLFDLKPGDPAHDGHAHYIDHLWFLYEGKVEIRWKACDGRQGVTRVLAAPCFLPILADVEHELVPLEPSKWACIFSGAEAERAYGDRNAVPYHLEKPRV